MPEQAPQQHHPGDESLLQQVALGIGFGLGGFLLNWFKLDFYFNVEFIFGSVLTMFALMRFGLVTGMTATIIAAGCTWQLWHHPWAIVIFCAETLCTSRLRIARDRDPVINNLAYWFTGGIGLVLFFYVGVMGFPLLAATVMGLKQGINGIFNTLIASALYGAYCFHHQRPGSLPSLRQLIFVTISLFVTIPALLFLYLDIRHTLNQDLSRHQESTVKVASAAQTCAGSWLDTGQGIVRFLAASYPDSLPEARRDLEKMRRSLNYFQRLGITDARGITVAFSPTEDERGGATIGLDLSGRSYLKRVAAPPHHEVMELIHGQIGRPGPRLVMAAPVPAGDGFRGVVFGVADLASLRELLRKLVNEHTAQITLVDERGLVVLSTKDQLHPLQRYALPPGGTILPVADGVAHWIPGPKPGLSPYKRWLASLYLKELPLEGHPGWKLVVESSLKAPLTALSEKISSVLAGIGLLLVLLLFCSRLFAGRLAAVVSDFERLTRELPQQVAAGATISWPTPATSELRGLTDNVKVMTRELQFSHAALKHLNLCLEERVEERTAQLRESRELLNAIIQTTPDHISVKDRQGNYLLMNKAGLSFLGRETLGRGESALYLPEEQAVIQEYNRQVFDSGAIVTFEQSRRDCRGETRVFNVVKGPVRNEKGEVTGIFAISRDITDRIQIGEQLEQERSLLRTIISTIPDLVTLKDVHGVYMTVNPAFEQLVGAGEAQIIGRNDYDIWPADEAAFFHGCDREVLAAGRQIAFKKWLTDRANGRRIFLEIKKTPMLDRNGRQLGILGIARDITAQHEAHEELKRRLALQERLKIIADTAPGILFEYKQHRDGTGFFPYVSASVFELWGFAPDEVDEIGSRVLALIHPEDRPVFTRRMSRPGTEGQPVVTEFRLLSPKGELWVKTSAVATIDSAGEVAWCGFITDITANKEAELVLRESEGKLRRAVAQRTADLRLLAERIEKVAEHERACVAQEIHDDLGQLLAALMLDIAWFQKRIPAGDETYAAKVKAVNELLSTTIQCARRITRDLRPRMLDELGLVAAMEEQLELYRQRQIECRLTVPQRDLEVDLERSNSLFRIFQESMTNVMRHSGATAVDILLDIGKEMILLEVTDNGCGISSDKTANLHSLGLLGIKERALRWGGTATITGNPGKGTTIRVDMPMERRRRKR
ncbi:sensor histidine kinase [Geomonas subterranea]|uniref:sensor histidine kinase n=1 Tax=Geomonas subterranea TaxID=2847989 RepID=UPI001CD71D44|nr:PAS domain S-box protein [Geomonas fuzhouensis]